MRELFQAWRSALACALRHQQPAVETRLLVSDLGWSREEAAAIRAQLAAFEEDWDAPGMEAYDRHVPDHPGTRPGIFVDDVT